MQLTCPRCRRVLEFSGERPSFCPYCGLALAGACLEATEGRDPHATPVPAGMVAPAVDEAPPATVGSYRLLRPLGGGGMGTVYEAEEIASGRRVALKLIAPEFAGAGDAVERFRQEGRLASAIAHPRCVFVLAADEDAGRPYIVMELMPGSTLEDRVRAGGPLPTERALAAILDVIEGLEEAHRHGVIHRDVKPSNCFLDADGRVKVGDFGLAKSLARGGGLTRTGSFLGTPLYASPEQIKGEPLDPQTDVYSTAATLYFLLTGRAPFESNDPAATLARIVSEPAPPPRALRPDLDPRLEQVILRGLERSRARRWRDLAEFRAALLPFRPGPLTAAGLGVRFGAILIDYALLSLLHGAYALVLLMLRGAPWMFATTHDAATDPYQLGGVIIWVLYFAVLEGVWGASPGKLLLRLRVRRARDSHPPGLARGLVRAAVWTILVDLGGFLWGLILALSARADVALDDLAAAAPLAFAALSALPLAGNALGLTLLLAPMRQRNGYRGLHELLSGTRVVLLPAPVRPPVLRGGPFEPPLSAEGCPERLGAFTVRGALGGEAGRKVLVAHDTALGREVWVWLRPAAEPPLSGARHKVPRATRLRWLASGADDKCRWDAFIAPVGGPLSEVVARHGRFAWPDVRPLLEGLTDELVEAAAEGTLPDALRLEQVWVRPDGGARLLDMAWTDALGSGAAPAEPQRALALVGQVAALALEGAPRPAGVAGRIRAPLPGHAAEALAPLLSADEASPDAVGRLQAALRDTPERPAEVTRARRAAHLALLTLFLFLGGGGCLFPAGWLIELVAGGMTTWTTIRDDEETLRHLDDPALRDRLERQVADEQRQLNANSEMLSPITRYQVRIIRANAEEQRAEMEKGPRQQELMQARQRNARQDAEAALRRGRAPEEQVLVLFALNCLLAWPVLWVVGAFLWRGGLSYRLLGIALVRSDGRPAARWQCAWRALLTWAPVTGLLLLSLWLQARFWWGWHGDYALVWQHTLATALWYAALVLLGGYAALALARPARALHDRLSGVYLVPR
jgi:uncharacterized RDD family membrane protein YckC